MELKTYRRSGHSRNDACGYRDKKEEKEWFEKDPIIICRNYILEKNLSTTQNLELLEKKILEQIDNAVEYAKSSPYPEPQDALTNVYFEGGK